jgi:acyl-CoA synthetase (AMP-forming)/AMP-acid ligase II
MDVFDNLMLGFGVALTPGNLMYCLIGALIGTLIGVLPGIGPVATVAMLLPITFYLPPVSALIMLAGIYYGAQYGGSTTAILVNLPGESSSVVTCLAGYQMARQGRAPFGVDVKVVDEAGHELPFGSETAGDLLVRGHWVVNEYFRGEGGDPLHDGWFATGDVACIDSNGFMQITDRTKDVIKSGGEWIGSIELENVALEHPAVAMAACIAVHHPKWDERPLLVVVLKPAAAVSRDELLALYTGRVASWWTPDDVVFVDALPLGATGKIQKNKLRDRFADYRLPSI